MSEKDWYIKQVTQARTGLSVVVEGEKGRINAHICELDMAALEALVSAANRAGEMEKALRNTFGSKHRPMCICANCCNARDLLDGRK